MQAFSYALAASPASETAASRAYRQIKECIVRTCLRPGAAIEEAQLMRKLGMGRTPIREALRYLEKDRLIVIAPRRGMFVTEVSLSDIESLHEIRMELDPLYTRLAALRMTSTELTEMRWLVARCQAAEVEGDLPHMLELDHLVHQLFAKAARNDHLFDLFESNYNLSLRVAFLYLDRLRLPDLCLGAFAQILTAIERQDPELARRAMIRHLIYSHEAVKFRV